MSDKSLTNVEESAATKKHRAVILLTVNVFPLLKSGECSGTPVPMEELKKFNLKPDMLVSVDGFDRSDCLRKLRKKIEEFNE